MRILLPLALSVSLLPAAARAEVTLSFYGGLQSVTGSTVDDSTLGRQGIDWDGKSTAVPPYWGARATWWRDDAWGFGLEFNHAKAYADNKAEAGYDTLEFTDGLNFATVNAFRRWQQPGRAWAPYVGAGVGLSIPHVEVTAAGSDNSTFGYQITGPVVQLVAGTTWGVNDRWELFGEWKGAWSKHEAELDGGGTLKAELITNALNLGISYRF
ncbi:outer membrane beta-barrel protein [Frigidibacter sp. MR17.14]|uniref:outer membrane beta-barrel protein n=1 Tax=Frigidibacter sp. MR17.14 TaxID=3126509 RepID=UPI003012F9EA